FLVAARAEDPACVLFADEAAPRVESEWRRGRPVGFYWTEGNRGVGWAVGAVPTLKGGSGLGIPSAPAVLLPNGRVVTPSLQAAERLQGSPDYWTAPAERVVPGRYRWRMVGNAVSVRAAEWLGRRVAEPGVFDAGRLDRVLGVGDGWPPAACGGRGRRQAVRIGEWPERVAVEPIERFLGDAKPLSMRATAGFVSRAERAQRDGKLAFPAGFLERLHAHAEAMRAVAV
ncbi:DNA cytosine methyltransferase, partial [bacterium]|nr:DNA cytosine methyltransferase [bacterium]